MKVYLAMDGFDYEGESVEAVFDSYDKALAFILNELEGKDFELRPDDYMIDQEWRIFADFNGRYETGQYWRIAEKEVL